MDVLKTKIIGPMKAIVQYPKYKIKQWLHTDDSLAFQPNSRKPTLSIEDRMMRCNVFNRNDKVQLLVILVKYRRSAGH